MALTLNNLGLMYLALARYQEALESLLQTLTLRREFKDVLGEAYTLNSIGLMYYALGNYKGAVEYHALAIPLWQEGNQTGEAYSLNNLGFDYWTMSDNQKALECYGRALSLWRGVGNH